MEIMANGLFSKFKHWMTEEEDYYDDRDMARGGGRSGGSRGGRY